MIIMYKILAARSQKSRSSGLQRKVADDQKEKRLRDLLVTPHLLSAGLATNPPAAF